MDSSSFSLFLTPSRGNLICVASRRVNAWAQGNGRLPPIGVPEEDVGYARPRVITSTLTCTRRQKLLSICSHATEMDERERDRSEIEATSAFSCGEPSLHRVLINSRDISDSRYRRRRGEIVQSVQKLRNWMKWNRPIRMLSHCCMQLNIISFNWYFYIAIFIFLLFHEYAKESKYEAKKFERGHLIEGKRRWKRRGEKKRKR